VQGVAGTWKDLDRQRELDGEQPDAQVRNIADVTTAVAKGDLSKKITVDVRGEILALKNTINTMVDQLSSFAAEVTRVAREVGTEGKLGGQAQVQGVSGTWKDLTDSVNFMAGNLTSQVRGIAKVVTAVADGDLQQKLTVEAKGEIAALADTINSMIDTLATFADQVTSVAREVGVEGKLGGQAKVPGASGTWKGLTENVNQLAENLTTQVRAIAEVATAVTQGDLTRSITVQAQGEVAALKDTINEMIRNLEGTTHKNTEQDWLKTNLAKFSRMLQGQKALDAVGALILSELAPVVAAQHAVFYVLDSTKEPAQLALLASYASGGRGQHGKRLDMGEGLIGQCAITRQKILLTNLPPDYVRIGSGLGSAAPRNLLVLPVVFEGQVKGRDRARVLRGLQPHAPGLPRAADGEHRHRDQHDRGEHPHGGPAEAVAVPRAGARQPPGRAAADEPGAAGKGAPARAPEPGGGDEEPRGGAGPSGAGGQGAAARTNLQVQVRVPRQHVARAAHAAEQPADPVRPALRQQGREPLAAAGRVRPDHPFLGQRPPHADQRHPRSLEDRVRARSWSTSASCRWTSSSTTSSAPSATWPRRSPRTSRSA
jgi:HAMP domain-containing protein